MRRKGLSYVTTRGARQKWTCFCAVERTRTKRAGLRGLRGGFEGVGREKRLCFIRRGSSPCRGLPFDAIPVGIRPHFALHPALPSAESRIPVARRNQLRAGRARSAEFVHAGAHRESVRKITLIPSSISTSFPRESAWNPATFPTRRVPPGSNGGGGPRQRARAAAAPGGRRLRLPRVSERPAGLRARRLRPPRDRPAILLWRRCRYDGTKTTGMEDRVTRAVRWAM